MTTGRRGRRERPIDKTVPAALAELVKNLRELRQEAGLTLGDLASLMYVSKATLSKATSGRILPRWELVEQWVTKCSTAEHEHDLEPWRALHERAKAEVKGGGTEDPSASPAPVPAPRSAPTSQPPERDEALEQDGWRSLKHARRAFGPEVHPEPIPVRYTTVSRRLTDPGPTPVQLDGRYDDIADVFALAPAGRLTILGGPRSGKTELARHLGTRMLTSGVGPVPVLLSLTTWHQAPSPLSLEQWLTAQLTAPAGANPLTLLARRSILPLLDDFDRLPVQARAQVLHFLNQLPAAAPFVLISNKEEFTEAVEHTDTVPAGSVGIHLQPLTVDDLDGWLQVRSDSRSASDSPAEWGAVLGALYSDPKAPAHEVLADPLLAGTARLLYSDGRGDPAELLTGTASALETRLTGYLLNQLVPRCHQDDGRITQNLVADALHLAASSLRTPEEPLPGTRLLYGRPRRPRFNAAAHATALLILSALMSQLSGLFFALALFICLCQGWGTRRSTSPRVLQRFLDEITGRHGGAGGPRTGIPLRLLGLLLALLSAEMGVFSATNDGFLHMEEILPFCVYGLLMTTCHGAWLRACVRSLSRLETPGFVDRSLATATHRCILRASPHTLVFSHPAIARWYGRQPVPVRDGAEVRGRRSD